MTSAKNVILKNINKHIDMKNLQIIKNFGFKSSNIARLFDRAINKSNRKNLKHIKSLNMFDTADHRKNNMRKQNENPKTKLAGSLYGKMGEIAMEEVNKHMTVDEFIEAMKPETTTCNICGRLITAKAAMMQCGPYRSEKTGLYVCPHCYVTYVQPLIDGLKEMKRTSDREELMKEQEYRC